MDGLSDRNHKILITGANGFIARKLIESMPLERRSNLIIVIRSSVNVKFINKLNVKVIYSNDLSNDMEHILSNNLGIKTLIHLAGMAHNKSSNSALSFYQFNYKTTERIARAAKKMGVNKFIFLSSASVYGSKNKKHNHRIAVSDMPNPDNYYGRSKLLAENSLLNICSDGDMRVVILRPPMVYGPGAPGNYSHVLNAVKRNLPLPIRCFSDNLKSFISIDNLTSAITRVIEKEFLENKIYLVSDNDDYSTLNFFKIVIESSSSKSKIIYINKLIIKYLLLLIGKKNFYFAFNESLRLDINYTISDLGWSPKLNLENSLRIYSCNG